MKRCILTVLFLGTLKVALAQYDAFVLKADSFYVKKDYLSSAQAYSEAFKSNKWRGRLDHRFNAAKAWAMAGKLDSAFTNLEKVAFTGYYDNYDLLLSEPDLRPLHGNKRWNVLLNKIRANKENAEKNLNKPLANQLERIYEEDQKYRQKIQGVISKYGLEASETQKLLDTMAMKDSVNLKEVSAILNKYGWLGPDAIGNKGSSALFLVVQHSNLNTQVKYLPLMREAVKNKKAQPYDLALLEDRVALQQGKRQIYGSQIGYDPKTGKNYVLPLEDPESVDKRRANMGLGSMADYLKPWNIKWDIDQYKKDLPDIEAKEKMKGN